jgi:hypothetical protein
MFTDAEKHNIVRVLGYPGAVLIPTNTAYSNIVNSRLNNLNNAIEDEARALLTRIEKLDSRLDGALDRASTKQVGDITLNPEEMQILRKERKRVVREMAELLDLSVVSANDSMIGVWV